MRLDRLRNGMLLAGAALVLVAASFQAGRSSAAGAEPGSAADPLVSRSYVDQYVQTYVNQQVQASLQGQLTQTIQSSVAQSVQLMVPGQVAQAVPPAVQAAVAPLVEWKVVPVPKGQGLAAGAGTEMVLRSGQARAVAGPAGGVADLTGGKDLGQGAVVPANHLLLAARADGRGISAASDLVVLVRGSFSYTGQ